VRKIKMLDLFAGCGGLTDGFLKTGRFTDVAAVEWLKPQVETLRNRLKTKWRKKDAEESVLHFDIQREDDLFKGWSNDPDFGSSKGLDYFVNKSSGIDIIVGGPPCQAYSVAGRVRDENGMKDDYRNFLFEHYLAVVKRYQPRLFVFENVPGLLSAAPQGTPIFKEIQKSFKSIGYEIIDDLKKAKVNACEFGVPQKRERLVIVGIKQDPQKCAQKILSEFYSNILPQYKSEKIITVKEAIGDLPKCMPFWDEEHHRNKEAYSIPKCSVSWHEPRYHSVRDMDTFKTLAEDVESGDRVYDSKKISELYEKKVGSSSPIHRYHVLEPDKPSTTIIAHLHKDGNRFIHYDSRQCRTITVREAARLQSFDDDFEFVGTRGNAYQMIGNAVPPMLAYAIAKAVCELLRKMG